MNTIPGSADSQAEVQIRSHNCFARIVFLTSPCQIRFQSASSLTACIKASETHIERLACSILPACFLTVMNSSMSGCVSSSISINAPLREPPCCITSPVATEYNCAQEHGPDAVPFTVLMYEPRGRNVERLI